MVFWSWNMSIKNDRQKLWQIAYKYSPTFIKSLKFWRKLGNPYSQKAIVHCDYCGLNVLKTNFQFPNCGAKYGEVDGKQLCIPCYEICKTINDRHTSI